MKKQVLYLAIILVAAFTPLVLEITFHNWWVFLSLIPAIPVIWWAQGKLLHAATDYVLDGAVAGIRKGIDNYFKSDQFTQAMDGAWKSAFGDLKAPAPKVSEPAGVDSQPAGKPELVATREWVDATLNTKLANVMRVDGEAHRQLLHDVPAYYLYTAETKDGSRIGRLFKGRGMGLALTQPIVVAGKNQPQLPDTDSLSEYQQWHSEAENEYNANCNHTSPEDWGKNPKKVEIPQDRAVVIIAWATANGHILD